MPLKRGYSHATFEANYQQLSKEGKPHAQALAIAYKAARESFWHKFPEGAVPTWMIRSGESRLNPNLKRKNNPIGETTPVLKPGSMLAARGRASSAGHKPNPCGCRKPNPSRESFALEIAEWCGQNALDWSVYEKMVDTFQASPKSYDGGDMFDLYQDAIKTKPRGKNPVPPSKHVQRRDAAKLYKNFTGHDALDEVVIDKPELPDVMLVVGDIDGIMYTTVRDGVTEKYVHQFKKSARPLFCVSPDGTQIHLMGGEYDFTERGIVDRS